MALVICLSPTLVFEESIESVSSFFAPQSGTSFGGGVAFFSGFAGNLAGGGVTNYFKSMGFASEIFGNNAINKIGSNILFHSTDTNNAIFRNYIANGLENNLFIKEKK